MASSETPVPATDPAPTHATERARLAYHAIIGVAIGLVSMITLFAWPFAILTGIVIGSADVDRMEGRPARGTVVRVLAVTGGVLAMLFFGAVIGGLFSFIIVALAAFSERVAANTTPTDRLVARILLLIVSLLTWIVLALVLKVNVNIHIG
jgi:hypothetical protein